MNIKILFLKSSLIIMGDVNEMEDACAIRNPVEILTKETEQDGQTGFSISFLPILQYTEEANRDGIFISKNEILSFLTPVEQLRNHYYTFFNKNE